MFPHRLRPGTSPHALRIPPHGGHPALRSTASGSPASEAINPAFGYGAPHLSARGTLTLLNKALHSAHFRIADQQDGKRDRRNRSILERQSLSLISAVSPLLCAANEEVLSGRERCS
jgi:hypothetical protein